MIVVDFGLLLASLWRSFGVFFQDYVRPYFQTPIWRYLSRLRNVSWQWNGKRVESCSSDAKSVWTCLYLPAMPQQNCWNKFNSSAKKKSIDFYALLAPIIFKIYQSCIKTWPQICCFLGALRVSKSLFLGVHMSDSRLVFDRQTTDCFLQNAPHNGPRNH